MPIFDEKLLVSIFDYFLNIFESIYILKFKSFYFLFILKRFLVLMILIFIKDFYILILLCCFLRIFFVNCSKIDKNVSRYLMMFIIVIVLCSIVIQLDIFWKYLLIIQNLFLFLNLLIFISLLKYRLVYQDCKCIHFSQLKPLNFCT